MKIGILTGGGDCPGLNAVIRGVVRMAEGRFGHQILGIRDGWDGLVSDKVEPVTSSDVSGILHLGGTILGSSRKNPFKKDEDVKKVEDNLKKHQIDALVAVGGDDTLGVAHKLNQRGFPCIGVPKTIDNDLNGTDYTFGFNTAVSIATEAIDRLHSTAEAHNRILVVEVMGRHTGWIAVMSGIAGGADYIVIPEIPVDVADICATVERRKSRGRRFSIIVVAEGARMGGNFATVADEVDEFGHVRLGGIGHVLAKEIERCTQIETRVTILGYVQRGGTPTAFDRVLATRFGVKAAEMVNNREFGKMAALRGTEIVAVDLREALEKRKEVNQELFDIARVFFG